MKIRATRGIAARAVVGALVAAVVVACGGAPADATDPIGSILSDLTKRVNTIIEKAGAEAQFTTLSAAGKVQVAIGQAQSAYATELNENLDDAGATTQADIEGLKALVHDLRSRNVETVRATRAAAQQLVNTIRFTNENPQLTAHTPEFFVPALELPLQLRIRGNFAYASENKKTPVLRVAGATYEPNLSTAQELGFEVPASVLPSPTDAPSPVSLELEAPYEKGASSKSVRPGVFRLLVTALPPSPVKNATLTTTVTATGTARADRRAPAVDGWSLNSYDCQAHSATAAVAATPGWLIVPSTVVLNYDFNKHPENEDVELAISQTDIAVKYSTRPYCVLGVGLGSGSIVIHLEYTEERSVSSSRETTRPLRMRWGDVIVEPVSRNQWKLNMTLFDGTTLRFSGSDHSNPYVLVDDEDTNVRVQVRAPERLAEG